MFVVLQNPRASPRFILIRSASAHQRPYPLPRVSNQRCGGAKRQKANRKQRRKHKQARLNCCGRKKQKPTEAFMTTWENLKKARRSSNDKVIGGVCGGLGEATDIPSWIWRVIFFICLLSFGFGIIPYIVLWICMPRDTAKKPE